MSVTEVASVTQQENRVQQIGVPDPRIAFFDHRAPMWDSNTEDVARTLKRLEELCARIGLRAGQAVLELGCGTGRITGWLVEQVRPGRVTAVDFSPAMLERARGRGTAAEFRLLDICGEIPAEEPYDVVFCFNAFPHFRNQFQALRNIRRLLKPAGQLVILHLTGSAQLNAFHSKLSHAVCHDHLPPVEILPEMLAWTGLALRTLTDEPELFLLKAGLPPGHNGTGRNAVADTRNGTAWD